MPASRLFSLAAPLGALLVARGCSPDQPSGGGHSPSVVLRSPEVSFSRAERSLPLAALPGDPTPTPPPPGDSLLQFPAATANFVGQGTTLEGCTFPNPPVACTTSGVPPYPSGAAGPNHYVQVVNGGIAIWNKSGTLVAASRRTNVLWTGYVGTNAGNGCATRNDGDASVLYDQLADRWFISQFSLPNQAQNVSPSFQCVAVSQTSDPTGAYYLYDFQYAAIVNDYPQFGLWPDAYYASFNNFGTTTSNPDVCAYERAQMVAGLTATQQCFFLAGTYFGLVPASLEGKAGPPAGTSGLFLNVDTGGNKLNLWKFHADFATPANSTLTGPTSIPVTAFSPACGTGGHLRSAAEPRQPTDRAVRPADAPGRVPQLRDARVSGRQPQRHRRDRGRRALVRAALPERDAHGLPARNVRARRELSLDGQHRPGSGREHRARVQPVEHGDQAVGRVDRAAGERSGRDDGAGGDRDRRRRGRRDGEFLQRLDGEPMGRLEQHVGRSSRRLHVLVHE